MKINILIVDDVKSNLISLEALLETIDEQYNIIQANNGREALEYALSNTIDLIILDIQMPDMDGFEVAKFLKSNKKTEDIPIIFLTAAFKSKEWVEKGFELGAVDYLTKPIDENQFINRITLYTKLIKSIDENRQKDKILSETTKMAAMGEMIGNIAHQWRQPLSIITTGATGLQLKQEYDVLTKECINDTCEMIEKNAQFLSKTIDDFRNFIKGDRVKETFILEDKLKSFRSLINPSVKANYISFSINIDKNIKICGYPNELIQCLMNIYNNAKDVLININENDRYILVDAVIENEMVNIKIKDSGGGIKEEIIDKIFEPYFTTKHQSQGTGLGLHITYAFIVNGMNGTISVTNDTFIFNDKEYKGACFTLKIPLQV